MSSNGLTGFGGMIKQSFGGDEYYTRECDVNYILPYISQYHKIWCPFDMPESNFVKRLTEEGHEVIHTHIFNGEDFFQYEEPPKGTECIVSNPPFSRRGDLFKKLFSFGLPFAMISNFNGLFDSRGRWEDFKNNEFSLIVPKGRMRFVKTDRTNLNSPNFQSVYVCHGLTDKQIVFAEQVETAAMMEGE